MKKKLLFCLLSYLVNNVSSQASKHKIIFSLISKIYFRCRHRLLRVIINTSLDLKDCQDL